VLKPVAPVPFLRSLYLSLPASGIGAMPFSALNSRVFNGSPIFHPIWIALAAVGLVQSHFGRSFSNSGKRGEERYLQEMAGESAFHWA